MQYIKLTLLSLSYKKVTDLASISPLVVVGARRMNRGGRGGVGQDVDEVWVHHVVVKQVKEAHSIRSICGENEHMRAAQALTVDPL